jgi:hypothetical protein
MERKFSNKTDKQNSKRSISMTMAYAMPFGYNSPKPKTKFKQKDGTTSN